DNPNLEVKLTNDNVKALMQDVLAGGTDTSAMTVERAVDVLLQLADNPNLEVKLTNDNVKALMQDVLAGGTDTSAIPVEWAMSELIKQPHHFEKATEELDRVIGSQRWVEESDRTHLPFLEAIVKETF
ncbi:cytochrome P450, partial [Salmonella sp. s58078]|uniref:cytochrome P450 n=1 Tax=Salmonella sp. s58078 TaxID=3159699 RepID=UPI00397F36FA